MKNTFWLVVAVLGFALSGCGDSSLREPVQDPVVCGAESAGELQTSCVPPMPGLTGTPWCARSKDEQGRMIEERVLFESNGNLDQRVYSLRSDFSRGEVISMTGGVWNLREDRLYRDINGKKIFTRFRLDRRLHLQQDSGADVEYDPCF